MLITSASTGDLRCSLCSSLARNAGAVMGTRFSVHRVYAGR